MKTQEPELSGTRIQSVDRAINLLLEVVAGRTDGSGSKLAAAVGLPVPTAHHLLGTLVHRGLLMRDEQARYVLGPTVAILADAYHRDLTPSQRLVTAMYELAEQTGETTYLAGWRHDAIQILALAEGSLPVRVSVASEPYIYPHARATGRLLLAHAPESVQARYLSTTPLHRATPNTITDLEALHAGFEEIRERGYVVEREEFQVGVSCAAVPIMYQGVVLAAFAMSVPSGRFNKREDELIEVLLDASGRVSE